MPVLLFVFILFCQNILAQARLTIKNSSDHNLQVKIMQLNGNYSGDGTLHEEAYIPAYSNKTFYFSETDNYYVKTKATKGKLEPVFKKGDYFEVYNGSDGYSVLTISFTIQRNSSRNVVDGKRISKSEFDKN